jgi:hypothetical protein
MNFPKLLRKSAALILLSHQTATGQVLIKGTVYDRFGRYPMPGVSVLASSGAGTMTDSLGRYRIRLETDDSIYLSWLGKPAAKYPVKKIDISQPFDMSLQLTMDSLASVSIRSKNYTSDSIATREEYKKAFDYQPDLMQGVKTRSRGMGLGLDMDMLIDVKANTRALALQQRLEQNEQDNYIDSRFTRTLVHKITGLEPPRLDTFMKLYRPSYEFLHSFETDYEFYKFISDRGKSFSGIQ